MAATASILTQYQITKILKGSAKAGITMGIVATKHDVRFLPVDMIEAPEPVSALDRFKDKRNARKQKAKS